MTIQTMLLMFGGLLLLIAIVGGGFEVRELKIPKVEMIPRIMAAIGGIVFIVMAINYDSGNTEENKTPPSASQAAQTRQSGDIILGTWRQYGYVPEKAQWDYLGTFDVAKVNGIYTVSAREQKESPDVVNSIGVFDVQSDGTSWRFNSNWGGGAVANFDLQRVSDTVFEGSISVESQQVGRTKWVRIQ